MKCSKSHVATILLWIQILNVLVSVGFAWVKEDCDQTFFLKRSSAYKFQNVEYPNYYRYMKCRVIARCDPDTRIRFTCSDLDITQSPNCTLNRLAVSISGDKDLIDSQSYCGNKTIDVVSQSNVLAFGMMSTWYGGKGRFFCRMTTVSIEQRFSENTPNPSQPQPQPSCECGVRNQRGVNKITKNEDYQFPFIAAIVDLIKNQNICGASIISNRFAITSAHCLSTQNASHYGLLVGDPDTPAGRWWLPLGRKSPGTILHKLESCVIHERYDMEDSQNDIALVKTVNEIEFSATVGPVCLPFPELSLANRTAQILGWIKVPDSASHVLRSANVTILSERDCKLRNEDKNFHLNPLNICTYNSTIDSCDFKHGGPIVLWDWDIRRYYMVGVISQGTKCNSTGVDINTKVKSYTNWINRHTTDSLCQK